MSRQTWARPGKGRRLKWKLAATIVAAVIVVFAAYSYSQTYPLEIKNYEYSGRDVPQSFDGLRIALVTDVHRAFYYSQKHLEDVVARVNALHPDLVLLGGDYVYGSRDYEAEVFAALAELEAPLGLYAIPGNHDYDHPDDDSSDLSATVKAAAAAGIPLLDNSGAWVSKGAERIRIAGVSDMREAAPDVPLALEGTSAGDLVVLLSHEPDIAEGLVPSSVDLVLSGHTHGGQITFFGLWAPFVNSEYGQKYRTGVAFSGDTEVIVSNGVGTTFPPLRFFAPPQIVLVTLHRSE